MYGHHFAQSRLQATVRSGEGHHDIGLTDQGAGIGSEVAEVASLATFAKQEETVERLE